MSEISLAPRSLQTRDETDAYFLVHLFDRSIDRSTCAASLFPSPLPLAIH